MVKDLLGGMSAFKLLSIRINSQVYEALELIPAHLHEFIKLFPIFRIIDVLLVHRDDLLFYLATFRISYCSVPSKTSTSTMVPDVFPIMA